MSNILVTTPFHSLTSSEQQETYRRKVHRNKEGEEKSLDEVSDEIAEKILSLYQKRLGTEYSYEEVLKGMNKAYLEMLAQFIEECDLDPDIYIEKKDEESLKAAQDYIKGHKGIFDPVKASGSMTIASDLFIAMLGHTVE